MLPCSGVRLFLASCCFFALSVAPAQADPLPQCDSDHKHTDDCQIQSADPVGLRFEKRRSGGIAEVRVLTKDGALAQNIEQPVNAQERLTGVPSVQDLDGDGRDELLISIESGGTHGNSDWAIWRATGDSTRFQRVDGVLFGGEFWSAGDDLFAVWGSGPMRSWRTTVYRFEGNRIAEVAAVQDDGFTSLDNQHHPCYLLEQDDLARYGLTPETARDRFCASTHKHVPHAI
ncbi:hypothetical protein [Segniliparus rugosus]|uniref:FG-GAP repeat protein n=1 Tax=Segniliparus rugosus (strain ATCC BAA-974 / DSM 45345 / CCUG 50838 / CIP 108380 / JCM 13579 / CDC 945) TaxID=679197 RepID=E5XSL6_SEGRC|nr:hypothetical protein [Segniliparus rugosus]EFV12693.1 hypothetical protein HMPREF9336_02488 [Segniliparus rugosus ATCC BAA-974]